jgi:uncharacterized membrane protein (DUF4010 family)
MYSPYVQIAIVLLLSLVMGLEREERKLEPGAHVAAGVRTIPLIALLGYMLMVLAPDDFVPVTAGLLAVASFLVVAYLHKQEAGTHGFTSELAALVAYVMGALVARDQYWVAVTIAVADVLLLSGKRQLQGFVRRMEPAELVTFMKFILLSAVILPILPNREFTVFHLNPLKTWLVVVAVSGISYASYLLHHLRKGGWSPLWSALLGGAYSSTITTVSLAKQSTSAAEPGRYAAAIVLASAVMYLRIEALVWFFNRALGALLLPVLLGMAAATALVALIMRHRAPRLVNPDVPPNLGPNPLELSTAFIFAGLFLVLTVATRLISQHLGNAGVYGFAVAMGATDVDPFIMSLTQSGNGTPELTAALGIIIATASNNLMKGIYAWSLGGRRVGQPALIALTALALVSVGVAAYLSWG